MQLLLEYGSKKIEAISEMSFRRSKGLLWRIFFVTGNHFSYNVFFRMTLKMAEF